jgi:predicted metal-dependent HD superfamily phosphohydrolase
VAILIDPPLWPAHGTVFSHLVSDESLAELHEFAQKAGLSERAFDRDHYDVPARRHTELVAQGARPVTGGDLIRALRASGLRVRARDRPEHLDAALTQRWRLLLPGRDALGAELLERWGEAHRHYHDGTHLLAVLEAAEALSEPDPAPLPVLLAAWFHDAVYAGVAGRDEQDSADLARDRLTEAGIAAADVDEVVRLVLLTASHAPEPGDTTGALLCDADLSVLGREPAGYARYLAAVRADYAHVSDADFAKGRAAVVGRLLELDPLFHTERGRSLWADRARLNLLQERRD